MTPAQREETARKFSFWNDTKLREYIWYLELILSLRATFNTIPLVIAKAEMQARDFKRQTCSMTDAELRRHASVSASNRHRCDSCFCCACVAELEKRADIRDKIRGEMQNQPGSWDW